MFTFLSKVEFAFLYNEGKLQHIKAGNKAMEFLYFPEDKSEYIPGIISVVIIFILSILIVWLLIRASRKQVKQLEEQGYPVVYHKNSEIGSSQEDKVKIPAEPKEADRKKGFERDKKS